MQPSYATNDPKGWMGDPRRAARLFNLPSKVNGDPAAFSIVPWGPCEIDAGDPRDFLDPFTCC
jgi:hypothetical protein